MKSNPYTPVHTTLRISDPHGYARIHTNGLETMINTECDWLINSNKSVYHLNQYGYTDTDYARALYKSRMRDLEYIRVDMSIYTYIMEGWC